MLDLDLRIKNIPAPSTLQDDHGRDQIEMELRVWFFSSNIFLLLLRK